MSFLQRMTGGITRDPRNGHAASAASSRPAVLHFNNAGCSLPPVEVNSAGVHTSSTLKSAGCREIPFVNAYQLLQFVNISSWKPKSVDMKQLNCAVPR